MEVNTLSIIIYVLVPILTAVLGGWVGAYFGNKYREDKESHEKEIVRNIAVSGDRCMTQVPDTGRGKLLILLFE